MPIIFKPISPARFKDDAFEDAMRKEVTPIAEGIERDYIRGWATWSQESKPEIRTTVIVNRYGGVSIAIDVEGEIYELVHEGTKPHRIRVRRAKRLRFQSGYRAKSKPGVIASGDGGPFGDTVYAIEVWHPGFEGRNFTKPILEKWRPAFERAVQRGLDRGAKESGHSI